MKKVVITVVILFIAVLSFLAGGRYGKGPSAGISSEDEPVLAVVIEGQENADMSLSPGAVKISPSRQQLIGVKVAGVEKNPMTYTLRLYGRVVPDETKIYRINASTDCWIRELSDVTTGSIVQKNQVLAEALAPAFFNAQVTYLVAADNIDRIRQQLGVEIRHQQNQLADNQIRMAVQTLQNLGITDAQIEELANTRQARPYLQVRAPTRGVVLNRELTLYQWFKAGEAFYTIADIGRVWVYADVYEDEARHMRPGMAVNVRHQQMGQTLKAKVAEVLPLFDPATRTLKVRIDIDNPRYDLRPDMFVDVEIPITIPAAMNVPAEAVIDTGTQAIVYVNAGSSIFEPRRVETGWRLGGRVEITGGLMPGEKIAVSGNFLIDSESRMEIAALGPEAKVSADPVCGMTVDGQEAEMLDRIAAYENETFYFCSDQCKEQFEKTPETYVRKGQTNRKKEDHAAMSGMDRSWLDMLESARGGHGTKDGRKASSKKTKDARNKSASSTGIVDWDGDAPAREWRPGWGGFPGAKYLGIKQKSKTSQPSDMSGAGGEKAAEAKGSSPKVVPKPHAHGSEMMHDIQKQPDPDQLQPSTK